MSGLAELLSSVGLTVTGSDLREGEETLRLRSAGIPVFPAGHRAEQVTGADVVVYSSAVGEDNPELVAARHAGTPVIKRAEMLAEVMRVKTGIAIAGSHGKTTTTSMTGSILQAAGLDPTIVVGGRVHAMGTNACLGQGEYLVAEADEYDRSFLRLRPIVAVVNNIDLEHLDTYRDLADLKASFTEFASTVPFFGAALLGLDDPNVQEIRPLLAARVRVGTFGLTPQADVTARDLALERNGSRFVAVAGGEALGPVVVSLPGLHNVKNALAAIAIARELDVPFEACVKALATFAGVARRFERKGERDGVLVVDDYAHHPTEVAATLGAARQAYPERRLVVLFQPHLFTRTRDQAAGFGAALLAADAVYVLPVYPSREAPIPGITSRLVSDAARTRGHRSVVDLEVRSEVVSRLRADLREGDLLVTMGAGDVNRLGEELLAGETPA
ncbi:MAG: UDP-N-acetylmuramate--L-alanine ligase [Holophagales bacterium]|jgi:UDP-N-acetylmuramate--alanine ligase|nr:UDP-N-acetylmuramate--L-alanine ligase [Holophagales bacterium]